MVEGAPWQTSMNIMKIADRLFPSRPDIQATRNASMQQTRLTM